MLREEGPTGSGFVHLCLVQGCPTPGLKGSYSRMITWIRCSTKKVWLSPVLNSFLLKYYIKSSTGSKFLRCQIVHLTHIFAVLFPLPPFCSHSLDTPKPPAEDRFILPDEYATPEAGEPARAKRSPINSNRVGGLNVETLVVADRKMLEKHGRENVTTYVLTVMNMVRARAAWVKLLLQRLQKLSVR